MFKHKYIQRCKYAHITHKYTRESRLNKYLISPASCYINKISSSNRPDKRTRAILGHSQRRRRAAPVARDACPETFAANKWLCLALPASWLVSRVSLMRRERAEHQPLDCWVGKLDGSCAILIAMIPLLGSTISQSCLVVTVVGLVVAPAGPRLATRLLPSGGQWCLCQSDTHKESYARTHNV